VYNATPAAAPILPISPPLIRSTRAKESRKLVARDLEHLTFKEWIIVLNLTIRRTGGTAESLADMPFMAIWDCMKIWKDMALEEAYGDANGEYATPNGSANGHHQPVA
jgi:hypothetical protein